MTSNGERAKPLYAGILLVLLASTAWARAAAEAPRLDQLGKLQANS